MTRRAAQSDLEREMAWMIEADGYPEPVMEHAFHPGRRWRFDFCWPRYKLALEIEGGTWTRGRHTRGSGFESDCIKYNEAALLGWRVLRVTGEMVRDGRALDVLGRALKEER